MSKLYVVVQVCHDTHYDYKMGEIRESFGPCVPFVFDDRARAVREAEAKRKARVPAFVCEFPFNPLDTRLERLEARVARDAAYIRDLEGYQDDGDARAKALERQVEDLRGLLLDVWQGYVRGHDWPADDTTWVTQRMRDMGFEV